MIDRRALLLSATALGGASALGTRASRAAAPAAPPASALDALFADLFEEELRHRPEAATQLGLDHGVNQDLRYALSDDSPAGREARRALAASQLQRLLAFDPASLGPSDRVNYDTVVYTRRSSVALGAFPFGGASYGPSPYAVSQLTGAYQATPDFLDTKHKILVKDDADAYLARLSAFADQVNANTDQMRHDAGLGVSPPDFLLALTLTQLDKTLQPPDQALVVVSLARRAAARGLGDGYGRDAARLYQERVMPALSRQRDQVRTFLSTARHDAGLWAFKSGPDFYETALRTTTTTSLTPEEVHRIGLEQAKEISARLDALLRAQGYSQGAVGRRMAALYQDRSELYPNTDAGKAQAIAYCNQRLEEIRPRLPALFNRLPPYAFEVRRVPPQTEAGAASAFSQGPAPDGSRPGLVYFNLHDTAEWPRFCLSTTVFHEGLPGHQLEGGLALSNSHLPMIRKAAGFSGYGEGWALYAEQLADEIGMYDDDPLGRLGYLKFQLFRANRCVVDTGIHHLRWSREQAVAYFVDQDGEAPGFAAREVERYCATPGQACSYKLGHTVFTDLRSQAKARLGPRFDIKAFHDAVLGYGRTPLDILRQTGERWIAQTAA